VERLYRDAVQIETKTGCTPQESAEKIAEELRTKGFSSYEDFATDSLAEELLSECDLLDQTPDADIVAARDMLEQSQSLGQFTAKLSKEFHILAGLPQNMQIKVSRLEPVGGPLTALSQNYQLMSHQISDWFDKNVAGENNNFATITDSVKKALFLSSASRVFAQCTRELEKECRQNAGNTLDAEREQVETMASEFQAEAKLASSAVADEVARILKACEEMHRTLLGLNTVRVTCNIENSRLGASANSLEKIIAQFGSSQKTIEEQLVEVETRCKTMAKLAEVTTRKEGESVFGKASSHGLSKKVA